MEGGEDVGISSETGSDNVVSTPVAALPIQDVVPKDVPKDGSDVDAASSETDTHLGSPVESSREAEDCRDVDTAVSAEVTRQVSEQVLDQLSGGLLANVLPDLDAAKTTLSEITENQRILIETVQQKNAKFNECLAMTDVMDTMDQARLYHDKLVNIKKTMLIVQEKTASLKKRAVKLQQQKQKEALQREQARDRESELERQLTAQPTSRLHRGRGSRPDSETSSSRES